MSDNLPKESRVNGIIDAALKIFIEKGFDSATMNHIAAGAGLSKGGVYHHFPDKDAILMAVIGKIREESDRFMEKAKSDPCAVSGIERYIRDYLNYWAQNASQLRVFFIGISKVANSDAIKADFNSRFGGHAQGLAALYQKGVEKGEFGQIDSKEATSLLLASLFGIMVGLVSIENLPIDSLINSLCHKHVRDYLANH